MALKQHCNDLEQEQEDASPKDDLHETLSTYSVEGDAADFHKAREMAKEMKLKANKEKQAKAMLKYVIQMGFKVDDCSHWLGRSEDHLQSCSLRTTCMEKRQAVKIASKWDFQRMLPVEVETYGSKLCVGNLRSFLVFRAKAIKGELSLGCSWRTFFKKLWYRILGKSLAWDTACKEALEALEKKMSFLKSEEGWGADFDKNLKELFQQPF